MKRVYRTDRISGFTLLEVMVAMAIMAIALVTIIQLFSAALRAARVSKDYSIAVVEAKKKMDWILALNSLEEFEELEDNEEFISIRDGYSYEKIGPDEYTLPEALSKDVEAESGDPSELKHKLYKLGIRVAWGKNKEVRFTTIKMLKEEEEKD